MLVSGHYLKLKLEHNKPDFLAKIDPMSREGKPH